MRFPRWLIVSVVVLAATQAPAVAQITADAPAGPAVAFHEDFEGNAYSRVAVWQNATVAADPAMAQGLLTRWSLVNHSTDTYRWDYGDSGDQFFSVGINGSALGVSGAQYMNDANTSLLLPAVDLLAYGGYHQGTLSFDLAGGAEGGHDYLTVLGRTKGAWSPWVPLGRFSDLYWAWTTVHLDVSRFLGRAVELRFRFTSDATNAYPPLHFGYNVDNVTITATGSPDATVPGAPSGLMATAGTQAINLTWSSPVNDGGSPVTGYEVLRGTSSGNKTPVATLGASTMSYRDASAEPGTRYFYDVVATNAVGSSAPSGEVNASATGGRLMDRFAGPTWQAIRFTTNATSGHITLWHPFPKHSSLFEYILANASGRWIASGGSIFAPGHDGAYVESDASGSPRAAGSWTPSNESSYGFAGESALYLDGSGPYTLLFWAAGSGVVPWNYTVTTDEPLTVLATTEGNSTGFYGATDFHGTANAMVEVGNVGARVEKDARLDVTVHNQLIADVMPGFSGHDNLTMVAPNGTAKRCYCGGYDLAGPGVHGPGTYEFRLSGWDWGNTDVEEIVVAYADVTLPS